VALLNKINIQNC